MKTTSANKTAAIKGNREDDDSCSYNHFDELSHYNENSYDKVKKAMVSSGNEVASNSLFNEQYSSKSKILTNNNDSKRKEGTKKVFYLR